MANAHSSPGSMPKKRPASTIARSFSATLDNVFMMSGNLDTLSQEISRKRTSITIQKTELEQLESRLRAMESELQEKQAQLPTTSHNGLRNRGNTTHRRKGLDNLFHATENQESQKEEMPKTLPMPSSPPRRSRARQPSTSSSSSSSSEGSDLSPTEHAKNDIAAKKVISTKLPSRGRA